MLGIPLHLDQNFRNSIFFKKNTDNFLLLNIISTDLECYGK